MRAGMLVISLSPLSVRAGLQRARDLYARYAGPSVRERAAGGNVDSSSQHCRFCRFSVLCRKRHPLEHRIQAALLAA